MILCLCFARWHIRALLNVRSRSLLASDSVSLLVVSIATFVAHPICHSGPISHAWYHRFAIYLVISKLLLLAYFLQGFLLERFRMQFLSSDGLWGQFKELIIEIGDFLYVRVIDCAQLLKELQSPSLFELNLDVFQIVLVLLELLARQGPEGHLLVDACCDFLQVGGGKVVDLLKRGQLGLHRQLFKIIIKIHLRLPKMAKTNAG